MAEARANRAPALRAALAWLLSTAVACPAVAGDTSAPDAGAGLAKALAQAAQSPRPALLRRQDLLRPAALLEVQLSPDGGALAFVRNDADAVTVWVQALDGSAARRVAASQRAPTIAWSGDSRHLWLADQQGLAVVERATRSGRRVHAWPRTAAQRLWTSGPQAPRHVVVHEKSVEGGRERHRYLTVDADGATRQLLAGERPLGSLLLDGEGQLAYAAGYEGDAHDLVVRDYSQGQRSELLRCRAIEACRLVGHDPNGQTVLALARDQGTLLSLRRWRRATGHWETVQRDPAAMADAGEVLWDAVQGDWRAVAFHGEHSRWTGRDPATRTVLAALERALPGSNLSLDVSRDGSVWLLRAQRAERRHDRWFLYRSAASALQPLFEEELAGAQGPPGVPMLPVSYRATDGRALHGYLLLPAGVEARAAPLVAWLHGGPVARVFDRYDPLLQLLANRGCAVFVPNFRGSSGYGLDYTLAAGGDVGNGRVLQDVIDGLDHLLARGVGDRERQAVMGWSFGGYASLLAASHHRDRFRVALAGAAPTDYGWIKQWQAEHDSEALRPEGPPMSVLFPQFGFRYRDPDWRRAMAEQSPLALLPALKTPVVLWAGRQDRQVPVTSLVHYAGEARRLDKPLTLLLDPDSGHVPDGALAAEAMLYLVEATAGEHLGGTVEPPSAALQAFLRRTLSAPLSAAP